MEHSIAIDTADGPMSTFVALPEGDGRGPALVVIQEAFGVNGHIKNVCRRLAAAGYAAFAPELFHRVATGVDLPYDDFAKVMPVFTTLTNDGLTADVGAALSAARVHPRVDPARVGVIGFCVGGFAAFLAAERLDPAAAVAFYGGGIVHTRPGIPLTPLLDDAGGIESPMLLIFGGQDQSIPPGDIDAIQQRLSELGKEHSIAVMPQGGHGFACDDRAAYHEASAKDAWQMTFDWLGRKLGTA